MAATLKDVARKAGVSIKTVSNVIHGNISVTAEKQQRVRRAIDELHYQPNLPARYLRKSHVGVIALAIPDLSNPYFAEIGNIIVAEAAKHSYTVLLDHTSGEREYERLVINGLRPRLIDGIILNPLALEREDLLPERVTVPMLLLGERFFDAAYDHVSMNNVAAARLAVDHLLDMGRRRIAAIGAQEIFSGESARLRLQGYTEGLAAAGIPFDLRLVAGVNTFHRLDGMRAMQKLLELEQLPDAVFCFNDLLAFGAVRTLQEAGLRVPEDVAVVGIDDIEESRYAFPSLTTISPDKQKIGELAVKLLLERIHGSRTGSPEHIEVPFRLVVRESTAGRSAARLLSSV